MVLDEIESWSHEVSAVARPRQIDGTYHQQKESFKILVSLSFEMSLFVSMAFF